jgi:ribosomal protein S27AE
MPWQAKEYERTCTNCGYSWRVPRSAARKRMRSISMISTASPTRIDRAELDREVSSIAAGNQVTEAFRHCPRCAAEQFGQHPWPSGGDTQPG